MKGTVCALTAPVQRPQTLSMGLAVGIQAEVVTVISIATDCVGEAIGQVLVRLLRDHSHHILERLILLLTHPTDQVPIGRAQTKECAIRSFTWIDGGSDGRDVVQTRFNLGAAIGAGHTILTA